MYEWILIAAAIFIMYSTVKPRNGFPRDVRTKFCAFMAVVGIVGFLLVTKITNWKTTFWEEQPVSLADTPSKLPVLTTGLSSDGAPSQSDIFYGIIFDAGSTGSRVHAMKFQSTGIGKPFKLLDIIFEQLKPGLSSYAKDPAEGAASLKPLLDKAKKFIPEKDYGSVPLVLKATAGLRLLPKEQSEGLLLEVKKLFKGYPFLVFDDSVGIMEGTDEGIFSWFTLNFFMGTMQNVKDTVGVMDLGGGSTQVTFVPQEKATLNEVLKDRLTEIDILGSKHQLYTHSYLGLGLMSARLSLLGGQEGVAASELKSVCIADGTEEKWKHAGIEYLVKGVPDQPKRYEACYDGVKKLLNGKIEKVREIQDDHFCTISYYYDRAVESGLIDEDEFERCETINWMRGSEAWSFCAETKHDGGNITVEQFIKAAETACSKPSKEHPFLCMDLTFISALLHDGFGFHKDTKLLVIKRVHGHEISWALGAMFNYFNIHHLRATKR